MLGTRQTMIALLVGAAIGGSIVTLLGGASVGAELQRLLVKHKDALQTIALVLQAIAMVVAAVYAIIYTKSTRRIREEANLQNRFAVCINIHNRMASEKSYRLRKYINEHFLDDLTDVAYRTGLKCFGKDANGDAPDDRLDEKLIFGDSFDPTPQQLKAFKEELDKPPPGCGISPLRAAECVLMDFDILALPCSQGIEPAKEVAKAYKGVLGKTAEALLPFVAIQLRSRGKSDPLYKDEYIKLLSDLGIVDMYPTTRPWIEGIKERHDQARADGHASLGSVFAVS